MCKLCKIKLPLPKNSGRMKRFSDGKETVVVMPPVAQIVEVEVPLGIVLVEVRDIPIAKVPAQRRKVYEISPMPLPIEGYKITDLRAESYTR